MTTTLEMLKEKREAIAVIAKRYGVSNIRVFGSVVRGEDDANSDIDFLVTPLAGTSLFEFMDLEEELQQLFGRKIDVISERGLSPFFKERILREAEPVA